MATQPTINELFGSESEDEDEQVNAQEPPQQPISGAEADVGDELGDEDAPERSNIRNINTGDPQYHEAVLRRRIGSTDLRLVRLSNLLNISPSPFDPATFEPAAELVYTDGRGKPRVVLPDYNCIRFRSATNPDGTTRVQSNSRFVRWSDGSLQLLIGDEVLDVSEVDTTSDHGYLYSRPKQGALLECEGQFGKKMVFRPATLDSKHHNRLSEAVKRHHVKVKRVQNTATTQDPAKAKAEREKREEERIRATYQLERKQTKALRGSRRPEPTFEARGARPGGVLNTAYLEAMDNDEYESESEADERPLQRDNLRRRNLDDEVEAERRLAEAKRPPPLPAPTKRTTDSLDSDDEGSISEDDEDEGRGANKQAQKRRQVVLSDDDDD